VAWVKRLPDPPDPMKLFETAGFDVSVVADPWGRELFVGRRR
jgi:hypothetical protein